MLLVRHALARLLLRTSALATALYAAALLGALARIPPLFEAGAEGLPVAPNAADIGTWPPLGVVALWPDAALAFVAFLLWGRRAALGVVLGEFAVGWFGLDPLVQSEGEAQRLAVGLLRAGAVLLQSWCGFVLTQRFVGRVRDAGSAGAMALTLLFAAHVGCALGASLYAGVLAWLGQVAELDYAWGAWWFGQGAGVLFLAPLLLGLRRGGRSPWPGIGMGAGMGSASVGLLVLCGWATGKEGLQSIQLGLPSTPPITALALAAAGLGLCALSFARDRLAILAASLPLSIGVAGVAMALSSSEAPVGGLGRPALNCALALAAMGGGVVLAGAGAARRLGLAAFAGSAAAAIGSAGVFGYAAGITPAFSWGGGALPAQAAFCFLLLGVGLSAWCWTRAHDEEGLMPSWGPLLGATSVMALCLMSWWTLEAEERQRAENEVQRSADLASGSLGRALRLRFLTPVQLARACARLPFLVDQSAEWEAEADWARRHLGGIATLEWVELSGEITRVVPYSSRPDDIGRRLDQEAHGQRLLELVNTVGLAQIIDTEVDADGRRLVHVLAPVNLRADEPPQAYVLGIYEVPALLAELAAEHLNHDELRFTVRDAFGQTIYEQGTSEPLITAFASIPRALDSRWVAWRLQAAPGPAALARMRSSLPEIVLGIGLLLALFVGLSLRLALIGQSRASELSSTSARLREAHARMRSMLSSARDPVCAVDRELRLTAWNQAWLDCVAREDARRRPLGRPLRDLLRVEEEARRQSVSRWRRALSGEETVELERYLDAEQVERSFEVRYGPVCGTDGEILGALQVLRDVSEREAAQAKAAADNERLRVENDELSAFASVASHDLQEPLRKILAFGSLLSHSHGAQLGPDGRDLVERMQSSATRMRQLIEDLLALARVDSERAPHAPVELELLASQVLEDLAAEVAASEAKVEVGALPCVRGDASQLRQLLQNLLSNALKFARPGIAPAVRLAVFASRGDSVELVCCDRGIGFEARHKERIFQPFERLAGHRVKGTGIGLAVCQRIVERHGGRIWAEPRGGGGACFHFELNLAHETQEASA